MELDAYQREARATTHPGLSADERLMDAAAGLSEEAGEVLSHIRKHLYFKRELDVAAVKEELGDVLWCAAAVATALGLSLGDVAAANVRKIGDRG
jgi:NTP pyrophosphatase (non-canonical NTP hydrolase)